MSEVATTVNPQITDSVTQVNTKVVGETPAMAMGNLLISTSHALSTGGWRNAVYTTVIYLEDMV